MRGKKCRAIGTILYKNHKNCGRKAFVPALFSGRNLHSTSFVQASTDIFIIYIYIYVII